MKLLRYGKKNNEKPAALDKSGKIRDLSSNLSDFDPYVVGFCQVVMHIVLILFRFFL